jgi:hypothetical protein
MRASALLDEPQQGRPTLSRLGLGLAKLLGMIGVQHLVTQILQVIVVDMIELHPEFEHGYGDQLRRLLVAGRQQGCPALLQGGENCKHLVV